VPAGDRTIVAAYESAGGTGELILHIDGGWRRIRPEAGIEKILKLPQGFERATGVQPALMFPHISLQASWLLAALTYSH
jgi:hypothetical protein